MTTNTDDRQLIRSQLNVLAALVLAAGAVSGGAYWYFDQQEKNSHLTTLEEVSRVEIVRPAHASADAAESTPSIVLKKSDNGAWFIEQPFRAKASDSRVETITALARHPFEHSIDLSEADLKQLDLDPPLVRVHFDGEEIALGGTDPLTKSRYVLHDGRIALLEEADYALLDSDAYGLCENRLTQHSADITAIQLGRFRLEANPSVVTGQSVDGKNDEAETSDANGDAGASDESEADKATHNQTDDGQSLWSWVVVPEVMALPGQVDAGIESLSLSKDRIEQWLDSYINAYALRASDGSQLRADAAESLPKLRIEMSDGQSMEYELINTGEETIFHDPISAVNHHFSTETQRVILQAPLLVPEVIRPNVSTITDAPKSDPADSPSKE
ncbi:MAG: DUF4340 domain-containing protein [Proteobacteria bacterium]|nr:DUF4340 domain-containing protein [Pseudomonadota bacterium]